MTLFPPLHLGWLNGWVPMVFFYGFFFILLRIFPNNTVDRLYDRTGWTDGQATAEKVGLPFALAAMILIIFTPLKLDLPVFWVGLMFTLISQVGFIYALHTFNITPLGEPATSGLYKFSRNPPMGRLYPGHDWLQSDGWQLDCPDLVDGQDYNEPLPHPWRRARP